MARLTLAPSTATAADERSPIISVAAVDAVRPGLRTAFAEANCPAAPPARRAGQPMTPTSGLTMRDAKRAAKRVDGSTAPSRTAAIGGTRVARRAGMRLASSVTPIPSAIETRTVRGSTIVAPFGTVRPIDPTSCIIAVAMP